MNNELDEGAERPQVDEIPDSQKVEQQRVDAARVGANIELRSVRLTRLDYESPVAVIDPGTEVNLSTQVGVVLLDPEGDQSALGPEDPNLLTYQLSAELTCTGESKTTIRAEICFEMVYELKNDCKPTQDEIDAFGAVSAAFSGFPYLRELIQSLTVRSELPPLTLGVMRSPLHQSGEPKRSS